MASSSFSAQVEQTLAEIFDVLDTSAWASDLDLEVGDGILSIACDDGAKFVLNRQEAVQQIWLATPWGGSHYTYDAVTHSWKDARSGETLTSALAKALGQKLGFEVSL